MPYSGKCVCKLFSSTDCYELITEMIFLFIFICLSELTRPAVHGEIKTD